MCRTVRREVVKPIARGRCGVFVVAIYHGGQVRVNLYVFDLAIISTKSDLIKGQSAKCLGYRVLGLFLPSQALQVSSVVVCLGMVMCFDSRGQDKSGSL
eukprot:g31645.t1